jgi:CheY-like chemotaxis protein
MIEPSMNPADETDVLGLPPAILTMAGLMALEPEPQGALSGRRVLVIDDEPFIALDLADSLKEAGADVAGPVGTVKQALLLIETTRLDAAVLDANLHGYAVDEVAGALARRHIPFVFVTGYARDKLQTAFKQAPVLTKPIRHDELLETLAALLSSTDSLTRLKS